METLFNIKNEIRDTPELKNVEIIEITPEGLNLIFKEGTNRTGKELLKVQKILFEYKIFNFIKSEKVDFWSNELKQIRITIY